MSGEIDTSRGAGGRGDAADDTVELQLTAAEQRALARASEMGMAPSPTTSPDAGYDTFVYTRSRRADLAGTITFAVVVCAITAAVGWHALIAEPVAGPAPTAPAIASSIAAPAQPLQAVTQVPNPFDASEVFELPANTSDAEAKNAIAEFLLERAQERRQQGLHLRHGVTRRPSRVAAAKPADVYVTKVVAPTNRFSDTPGPQSGIAE
jgi:hypothetical protein